MKNKNNRLTKKSASNSLAPINYDTIYAMSKAEKKTVTELVRDNPELGTVTELIKSWRDTVTSLSPQQNAFIAAMLEGIDRLTDEANLNWTDTAEALNVLFVKLLNTSEIQEDLQRRRRRWAKRGLLPETNAGKKRLKK